MPLGRVSRRRTSESRPPNSVLGRGTGRLSREASAHPGAGRLLGLALRPPPGCGAGPRVRVTAYKSGVFFRDSARLLSIWGRVSDPETAEILAKRLQ